MDKFSLSTRQPSSAQWNQATGLLLLRYRQTRVFRRIVGHVSYRPFTERGRSNHLRRRGAEQRALFAAAETEAGLRLRGNLNS